MNPKNTDEKRKLSFVAMLTATAVGLIIVFELAYIVVVSLPGRGIYSHFSPKLSEEDQAMLELSLPAKLRAKKAKKKNPVPEVVAKTEVSTVIPEPVPDPESDLDPEIEPGSEHEPDLDPDPEPEIPDEEIAPVG
jgi:hypothetical protein